MTVLRSPVAEPLPAPSRNGKPFRYVAVRLAWALAGLAYAAQPSPPPPPASGAAIRQDLRSFNTVATVLHIAAHPDDENTALITYFARGRGYRMGYLSLTRGDGGQNEIGPEFDEKLGVARTQELLAARKLDGGRQFFTRAIDFGFSKTAEETLRFWPRDQVLADVVRVIRQFRPDVIVTRFSPASSGSTHGHHTTSGILGAEAFKLAADPKAYPEQLEQGLTVWQPKRVVLNTGSFGGTRATTSAPGVKVDIGGNDPVTGEAFSAIASRSRAMHITQGFGNFGARGASGGPNEQTFVALDGEPAGTDLMDGIDTTWTRIPGGAAVGEMTAQAIAAFDEKNPAASVPALLEIKARLAALPVDPVIDDKRAQLDRILQACLGLTVEAIASTAEVVPGERLRISYHINRTATMPVTLREWRVGETRMNRMDVPTATREPSYGPRLNGGLDMTVPATVPLTQPYWLREEGAAGIFRVNEPELIGLAENPPAFPVEFTFDVGGQKLTVPTELVHVEKTAKGEKRRRVDVVSPVALRFAADVSVFTPGATKPVVVEVSALRQGARGTLSLQAAGGWRISPASQPFQLTSAGGRTSLTFSVTAPSVPASDRLTAIAEVAGKRYSNQRIEINYPHLPLMLLQPPARARLLAAEVAVRGKSVGYLPGAGDDTAEALAQLGYQVTTLSGADLDAEKLRGLDAIVLGVRAFNERKDLAPNLAALWAYVENGGTVIAQYNRPSNSLPKLGPYELSIAGEAPRQRITDETAPVSFLAPDHPALNTPNRIGPADFAGWVQERGAYFPSKWDEHYQPLLAMNDPGEAPLNSGVLVARHGRGHYVYTGIAFFRQLPAGVPGAYRLFANLVSLGK